MINTLRLSALTADATSNSASHTIKDAWKICRAALGDFLCGPGFKLASRSAPIPVSTLVPTPANGDAVEIYDADLVKIIELNGEFIATQYRPLPKWPNSKGKLADIFEPEHLFRYDGALFNCHKMSAG
jgi:hypothetical protein